jgi:hypothetical protein
MIRLIIYNFLLNYIFDQELVKELLEEEKNHCRECVKAAVESIKGEMKSYIDQQQQVCTEINIE